ncbi:8325_t:CDS:2, partial [Racocetra fulgida]
NVKKTFEATIEHLLKLEPPIKNQKNKRQALISSLQALMKNDKSVREEYESLNAWVNVYSSEKEEEKALKIYNISYGTGSAQTQKSIKIMSEHEVSTDIKEAQEINPLNRQKVKEEKEDDLSSRIPHKFSFSAFKQGDEDAFESLLVIKRNLSSELTEQYVLPMKRRHENNEDEIQERKRHMTNKELGELIDFTLNIVNKLEPENKEHLNQIVRLASKSSVTVYTRVKENPGEFQVEDGVLFCNFCDHSIDWKQKSTVDDHLKSKAHISKKAFYENKQKN